MRRGFSCTICDIMGNNTTFLAKEDFRAADWQLKKKNARAPLKHLSKKLWWSVSSYLRVCLAAQCKFVFGISKVAIEDIKVYTCDSFRVGLYMYVRCCYIEMFGGECIIFRLAIASCLILSLYMLVPLYF